VAKDKKVGHKGEQENISRETPEYFYNPYGNYNLNLLLGDVAKSSVTTVNFLELYKNLYICSVNISSG
jgi:hypothetical protein